VVWVATDPWHGLARSDAHIELVDGYAALTYSFSTVELFGVAEAWILAAYACVFTIIVIGGRGGAYRTQAAAVSVAMALPIASSVLALLFGVRYFGQRDGMPVFLGIAACIVTWALFRRQLFDLVPVARETVFDELPDPVVVVDGPRRLVDANPAAFQLFGASRADFGRSLKELAERSRTLSTFASALEERSAELSIGERTFAIDTSSLEREVGATGSVFRLHDITERRRMNEILEQRIAERTAELAQTNAALSDEIAERRAAVESANAERRKFRTAFDNAASLLGVVTPEGTLVSANARALCTAGVTEEAVLGKPFWLTPWWAHDAGEQAHLRESISRAAGERMAVHFPTTHRRPDGALRQVEFSLTPVLDEDGRTEVLIAEGRDVTEQRREAEERRRLEQRLQTGERFEALGRLAGGVAHDINNVLTVVQGNAELLQELLPEDGGTSPLISEIQTAAESATGLARQLLMFARRQVVSPRVLHLDAELARLEPLLARALGEDISLHVVHEHGSLRVALDPTQLEQIVMNLCVNARDAMPSGGTLEILTRRASELPAGAGLGLASDENARAPSELAVISVTDTGMGIPPDVLDRIFEPFFTTKAQTLGTGLGLATTLGAVSQAGGVIDVSSTPGHGTTFRVFLPICDVEVPARASTRPAPPRGTEHLVLVEDQDAVRNVTARHLERLGFRVTAYASPRQALAELVPRLGDFDLLLCDVIMPGLYGTELARRLRESRPELPVLFMSGYTDAALAARGVDTARLPVLAKPFTREALARAVASALRSATERLPRVSEAHVSEEQ
jgi:PAS domain S-box-containing protein